MTSFRPKVFFYPAVFFAAFSLFSCSGERASEIKGMVYIPSGEFIMGSDEVDAQALGKEFGLRKGRFYEDESPRRKVSLDGFYMDIYEVTNRAYKEFVDATGYNAPGNRENRAYPPEAAEHPVTNVTWFDAHAFCQWAGKRLPTEEEWEKAYRGPNGNIYPWGTEFDIKKAVLDTESSAPVGSRQSDKSYYGVYDMAGNVMEWVDSWYGPYPGNTTENKDYGKNYRVLRGDAAGQDGHYMMNKISARGSNRNYYLPGGAADDGGFRCAKSLKEDNRGQGK
ncbi:MAG: SUMF1/EgtB/PvdO family nonheme iron enzyme [Deltaproteobacteria bacterium]|nr:SUMF1/EgtB/PvdO family nonheme iron enzyme [Deltaproteobacteria bacterium]